MILAATLILLLTSVFIIQEPMRERAVAILTSDDGGTKNTRIKLWQEALSIIKDFPMLGSGPNTYTAIIQVYKKPLPYTGYYPHNCYLHMAAEMGILGLGAFIWVVVTLFKVTLANLKMINSGLYGALLLGLLAGLFGFLGHSFIDTDFYTLQLGNLMWFVMGLIIAVQKIALGENS